LLAIKDKGVISINEIKATLKEIKYNFFRGALVDLTEHRLIKRIKRGMYQIVTSACYFRELATTRLWIFRGIRLTNNKKIGRGYGSRCGDVNACARSNVD